MREDRREWEHDLRLLQFTLKVAVLEPYADAKIALSVGTDPGIHFERLESQILAAVEKVVEDRAGSMKGLVQVRSSEVKEKNVGGLIRDQIDED